MGIMIEVRIRQAALARGVENPKQLADKMGCAPKIIWELWTGVHDPKLKMLDRICEALDCGLDELVVRHSNGHRSNAPQKRRRKDLGRQKTKAAKLRGSKRS